MEWQRIVQRVKTFRDLPEVHPVPTLCTHVPFVIFLMSVMASDLSDGKLKFRGALGQIGPDNGWFYVILSITAIVIIGITYRAATAVETLSGYTSK